MPDTTSKSVVFYGIDYGRNEDGTAAVPFPAEAVALHLHGLTGTAKYLHGPQAEQDFSCYVSKTTFPVAMRFAKIRRGDWPGYDPGDGREPEGLPFTTGGLTEETYCLFVPGDRVGIIFSGHGPRHGQIRDYIRDKMRLLGQSVPEEFALVPLVRRGTLARLEKMRVFKEVGFRIRPSFAEALAQAGEGEADEDWERMMHYNAAAAGGGWLTMKVSVERRGRENLGTWVKDMFTRALKLHDGSRRDVTTMNVKGAITDDGNVEVLNLFGDRLSYRRDVLRDQVRKNAVDPQSALAAIADCYATYKTDVDEAEMLMM